MKRTVLLKILWVLPLVAVCRGYMAIRAVNPHESTCTGGTVTFEAEITGAEAEFVIEWIDQHGQSLDDSEHFSLDANRTVLTITNALPPHAGVYFATVKYLTEYHISAYDTCLLEVQDIHLQTLVKNPVKIDLGGKGILKVNKSEGGELFWVHNGKLLVVSQDSRYTFLDDSSGTELEISDATAEQAGLYDVVLMKGGCEVRNIIDVQVQEQATEASPTEDPMFLGIIDRKYLGFFSGDFTGEWYYAPLALGPVVILLLVLVVCMIRRSRSGKRSEKDKGKVEVTRVVYKEPIYTVQDQVFYPPADPTYDVIAPVTTSHPQSSSLGAYGDMSIYGRNNAGMATYDTLHGRPTVPAPAPNYSAMSDEEFFSDY